MTISRGSVPTLVDRGRQKKKSSAGDQELSELEKLALVHIYIPGDFVLAFAFFVTELLLMNFPHALSKLATKPLSLAKAVRTNVLYFL